jgi:hypothetical protein
MTGYFQPTIAHALFGQGGQQFECPELMTAALDALGNEIVRVVCNLHQNSFRSPRDNAASAFRCETFGMWAYSWGDDDQPYNFFHPRTGIAVSWYKYGGRGESCNVALTPDVISEVFNECLEAVRGCEDWSDHMPKGGAAFLAGSLGEVSTFPTPEASHD